jgi:5-methyltetrahydropteroyltriglutamate--homocysteine methyltransferase
MRRDIPNRADHVGSLLLPPPVKQARSKHASGQLSAVELKVVEDAEIKKIIAIWLIVRKEPYVIGPMSSP